MRRRQDQVVVDQRRATIRDRQLRFEALTGTEIEAFAERPVADVDVVPVVVIVVGILANLAIYFRPSSLFDTLVMFGLMQYATALRYRMPMPVQPLKAVAALVITRGRLGYRPQPGDHS